MHLQPTRRLSAKRSVSIRSLGVRKIFSRQSTFSNAGKFVGDKTASSHSSLYHAVLRFDRANASIGA